MPNIAIEIDAKTIKAEASLKVFQTQLSAANAEMKKIQLQANATDMSGSFTPEMLKAAEAAVQLQTKIKAASAEVKAVTGASAQAVPQVSGLSAAFGGLQSGAAALGLALSAQQVVAFGERIFESTANLQRQADALGISTDQLQAFQFAARNVGVDTATADAALQKFFVGLGQAAEGTGPALKAYQDLGINVGQLAANTDDAAAVVATALLKMDNQYERDAAIREIFGRSGQDVNAMLAQLALGFNANRAAAQSAGEFIGKDLVKASLDASIAFDKQKTVLNTELTPAVTNIASHISDVIKVWHELETDSGGVASAIRLVGNAVLDTVAPWRELYGAAEDYNKAAKEAAGGGAPKPPPAGAKPTAEQIDVKGLEALDSKLRERRVLTDGIAQATRTLAEAQAAADAAGIKSANEVMADLKKQLDTLNKQPNAFKGTGFANAGAEEIALVREQAAAVAADESKSHEERFAEIQSFYAKLLASGKLNAAQRLQVQTDMDRQLATEAKAEHAEELAIIKSNADTALQIDRIELAAKKANLEQEVQAGQITAAERLAQLREFTIAEGKLEEDAVTLSEAWMRVGTAAYAEAENKKLVIHAQTAAALAAIDAQAAAESAATWQRANAEIFSAEDQLVNGLFSQNQSLVASLANMAEDLVKKEIAADLKYLTQSLLIKEEGVAGKKAVEQAGFLFHLLGLDKETAADVTAQATQTGATIAAQAAQTGATVAGVAAQTTAKAAGAVASKAVSAAANSEEITHDAAVAAAGAYKAVVGIPYIGPVLAPIAAGVAFAAVEAFGNFDVGTNYVPRDMPAMVHAGERIIPKADNKALMQALASPGGRSGGSNKIDINYAPNLMTREPRNFSSELASHSRDLANIFKDLVRDGSIKLGGI